MSLKSALKDRSKKIIKEIIPSQRKRGVPLESGEQNPFIERYLTEVNKKCEKMLKKQKSNPKEIDPKEAALALEKIYPEEYWTKDNCWVEKESADMTDMKEKFDKFRSFYQEINGNILLRSDYIEVKKFLSQSRDFRSSYANRRLFLDKAGRLKGFLASTEPRTGSIGVKRWVKQDVEKFSEKKDEKFFLELKKTKDSVTTEKITDFICLAKICSELFPESLALKDSKNQKEQFSLSYLERDFHTHIEKLKKIIERASYIKGHKKNLKFKLERIIENCSELRLVIESSKEKIFSLIEEKMDGFLDSKPAMENFYQAKTERAINEIFLELENKFKKTYGENSEILHELRCGKSRLIYWIKSIARKLWELFGWPPDSSVQELKELEEFARADYKQLCYSHDAFFSFKPSEKKISLFKRFAKSVEQPFLRFKRGLC